MLLELEELLIGLDVGDGDFSKINDTVLKIRTKIKVNSYH
jgi:hypothetical protein